MADAWADWTVELSGERSAGSMVAPSVVHSADNLADQMVVQRADGMADLLVAALVGR